MMISTYYWILSLKWRWSMLKTNTTTVVQAQHRMPLLTCCICSRDSSFESTRWVWWERIRIRTSNRLAFVWELADDLCIFAKCIQGTFRWSKLWSGTAEWCTFCQPLQRSLRGWFQRRCESTAHVWLLHKTLLLLKEQQDQQWVGFLALAISTKRLLET